MSIFFYLFARGPGPPQIGLGISIMPNRFLLLLGEMNLRTFILQLKFYRRFKRSLGVNSVRSRLLNELLHPDNITKFLKYYVELDGKYENPNTIYTEAMSEIKNQSNNKATNKDKHYKFYIYKELNPDLLPSPFLSCPSADAITRFRCGSHHLPIETMRWGRVSRENRLCPRCGVLGDEYHFLFDCVDFPGYFESCNRDIKQIWKHDDVFKYTLICYHEWIFGEIIKLIFEYSIFKCL